jgi:aminopeptidase N
VSLGYRLGHIRGDSRIFRAVVYNKGAAVLHMLRRLMGDEAFFRGLQQFYREQRFRKAGTDDFRRAMEEASGRPLQRFFDEWIDGTALPKLRFSYRVEPSGAGHDVVLHVEQVGEIFDVPLTVTIQYADRTAVDVHIPVTERAIDMRVALAGPLRAVDVNLNDGTLAEVEKS